MSTYTSIYQHVSTLLILELYFPYLMCAETLLVIRLCHDGHRLCSDH